MIFRSRHEKAEAGELRVPLVIKCIYFQANFIFPRTHRDLCVPQPSVPEEYFFTSFVSPISFPIYVRTFLLSTTSSFFPSVSRFLFVLLFSLSLLLFTFISRKLEPRRPPIITGEIIKKAGAGEILKRWREGRLLSAGRYRLTAMLGSTSYPLCIFVSLLHPRVSSFLLRISLLLCLIPFCIHNRFYVTDCNYLATSFFLARLR